MLCVVDDAHWLDPATADALLFCARRLGADRVLMVFSARDEAATPFRPDGIAELRAGRAGPGRGPGAARRAPGGRTGAEEVTERLDRRDRRQPAGAAGAADRAQPRTSSAGPPRCRRSCTSPTRVEQAFLDRSRRLSAAVQTVLLLAAADDTGDLAVAPPRSSDPRAGRAGPGGRRGVRAAGRRTGRSSRCAIRWCGRRSTRPPRARNGDAPTGRWPRPWPESGTRTARPGTAPPPPRARTPRWSRPSSVVGSRAERRGGLRRRPGRLRARRGADDRPRRSVPR